MSHTERANYPTDLTDEQWQILCKLLPRPSRRGAPQTVCRRAVVNAILYVLRTGCTWRFLPHDFPKWKTIYGIFLGPLVFFGMVAVGLVSLTVIVERRVGGGENFSNYDFWKRTIAQIVGYSLAIGLVLMFLLLGRIPLLHIGF